MSSTVVVKNRTGARAPVGKVLLFLVADGGRAYGLGDARVPATDAGSQVEVIAVKAAPSAAPAGRYAVRACLTPRPEGACRTSRASVTIRPARLVAEPADVDFGDTPVGSSAGERTVTITNRGNARTGVVEPALTGDGFAVSSLTCGPSLVPGASCEVGLDFSPESVGEATGRLVVQGRRGGSTTVPLTGTGTGEAALAISPARTSFDDTLVGAESDAVRFTVSSVGLLPTGVPNVSQRSGSGDFEITEDTCTTALAPGQTCAVSVVLTPQRAGLLTDALTVSATPGGSVSADLEGTGLAPAALVLTPPTAAFGSQVVGGTTGAVSLTLANTGDVASGTPTVALGGIDADQFVIVDDGCTGAVAADDSCTVDVAFAPTATGSASASLDVSATPGGADSSTLTGTGETRPVLAIDQASYDFGFTDAPTEHPFTITNTGTTASGVPEVAVSGSAAFTVTSDTCTAPLPGGATCTVGVTYTGSGQDVQAALLAVSATPGGTVTAELTGSPRALTVAPDRHDYGGVLVGETSAPVSYTLTNHRLTPVQVDGEGVTGPFPLETSCFQAVLPAGGTCTFSAGFAPASPGAKTGTVDYVAQGGFARVELTGEGLAPAAFSVSPSTVDFGAYSFGRPGRQQITITNTGTQTSSPIEISGFGPNASDFFIEGIQGDCPSTLPGGESCTATIGFNPRSLGDKSATLTVAGAPGGTASLVGLGAPAGVTLVPATYDYGAVAVGGSATHTFRVVNTTDNVEEVNSASTGSPFSLDFSDFTCVLDTPTLQPHRWCTMSIVVRPQTAGSFSGTLTAGGANFSTQTQLSVTGVPARRSSGGRDTASGSLPQSVELRDGEVVVRRG